MSLKQAFFIVSFFAFYAAYAQELGSWQDHLPYNNVKAIAEKGNKIYCATRYGLFTYDKNDNSLERMSKVTGLSDVAVSTAAYDPVNDVFLLAYENANLDILENDAVINIADIKRKNIPGKKIIHKIMFYDSYAFLATGFGIVVLDVTKKEIKETYIIGPNGTQIEVFDLTNDGTNIYAATEKGIYKANINDPTLVNFASWTLMNAPHPTSRHNTLAWFDGKLYANYRGATFNTDTVFVYDNAQWSYFDTSASWQVVNISTHDDELVITNYFSVSVYDTSGSRIVFGGDYANNPQPVDGFTDDQENLWIGDGQRGLVRVFVKFPWASEHFFPNGPATNSVFSMSIVGEELWVASGGRDGSFSNVWNNDGVFYFSENEWYSLNGDNTPAIDTISDIVSVAANPANSKHVFAGSWYRGLLEFSNGQWVKTYMENNSTLKNDQVNGFESMRIGSLAFDHNNNLWVSNSLTSTPLAVRKPDGNWKSFSLLPHVNNNYMLGDMIVDQNNRKWIALPRGGSKGILVYDDNETVDNANDDKMKKLVVGEGNGNLPDGEVWALAEDHDGEIWAGTSAGIAVFYSPESIFDGGDIDAQRILIERDGYVQYLLESETVTSIAVDGGNRKWIGTRNAGVFLISEDGTKELLNFNEDNSPLLSNNITAIAINHESGDIFFGTEVGLVSYKSTATGGGEDFEEVLVYPNPVREDYEGPIAIRGLASNVNVKITDISGTLIYETTATGGQAIWNGRNFNGERAHTGVYLVFCSNKDGTKTYVAKILMIKGEQP